MGWCNVRRFISIVMFRLLVTLGTWQCFWHSRVEIAIEPIASHSDVLHLLRAKVRGWVLLVSGQYFERSLRIFHTKLCHHLSFTHNCRTHHLSNTTLSRTTLHIQLVLLLDPPPPPLSFLPFPSPLPHLLLITERSWLVGLSGPLFFAACYCNMLERQAFEIRSWL